MRTETTRRSLFGAGAGLMLLAAQAAGGAKAAELDGELLALEAELQALEKEADAAAWSDDLNRILDRYWQIADRIGAIPARTPEGIQCKARVLRSVRNMLVVEDESDHISRHTLGLVRDLLGEG